MGSLLGLIGRLLKRTKLPVCPECGKAVVLNDQVFLHSGLVFHKRCLGYKKR